MKGLVAVMQRVLARVMAWWAFVVPLLLLAGAMALCHPL